MTRYATIIGSLSEVLDPGGGEFDVTCRIPVVSEQGDHLPGNFSWVAKGDVTYDVDDIELSEELLTHFFGEDFVVRLEREAWARGQLEEDTREHPDE